MADKILNQQQFNGGISVSDKIGVSGSYAFSQNIDIHQDPTRFSLQTATVKASGTTVTDSIKWIVSGAPYSTNKYFYGDSGKIYQETSAGVWSTLRTVSSSHGQGMCVYQDYLYYVQDSQIGRYGPLSGSPAFTDNWQTGLTNTAATGFAPCTAFSNLLVIGHGNIISTWDNTLWTLTRITLIPGHNVRTFSSLNEYVSFGTWRSTSGNIYESEEGYVFFWDGVSNTFNFFVEVPEGACNALQNTRNTLLGIMGSTGILYQDTLSYSNQFDKLQNFPKLKPTSWLETYPGAMNNWNGKTYWGVSNSNSSDIIRAVYEWGSISKIFPAVLNCPFTISTGNSGSTVQVTAVSGFGTVLYIAWKDGSNYGVDKVTKGANFYTSGYLDTFYFDNAQMYTDKLALVIKVIHSPLLTGESVQLGYSKNRAAFTFDDAHVYSATDDKPHQTRFVIPMTDARFAEFAIRTVIGGNGSTTPYVYSVGMKFSDLADEEDY